MTTSESLELKLITHPTFKLRSRLCYNDVKAKLLGIKHDPFFSQVDELLEALSRLTSVDIDRLPDKRTLEKWHEGATWPFARHQAMLKEISPSACQWLEPTVGVNHLQRHLFALDGLALELPTGNNDIIDQKNDYADKIICIIDKIWSCFTRRGILGIDRDSLVETSTLKFENQVRTLSESSTIASCLPDTPADDWFNIPSDLKQRYVRRDKSSLLSFLLGFADWHGLKEQPILDFFAVELASLGAVIRTKNYTCAEEAMAFSEIGTFAIETAFVARLFWEEDHEDARRWWELLCPKAQYRSKAELFDIFLAVRQSYYKQFANHGISQGDLMEVAALYGKLHNFGSPPTPPKGSDNHIPMTV